MLYPVIKCECGNKKVADPRGKPLEQILNQKWCSNCRRRGCWDLYLQMKLDGIDKIYFFCFSISSSCLKEGIDLPI